MTTCLRNLIPEVVSYYAGRICSRISIHADEPRPRINGRSPRRFPALGMVLAFLPVQCFAQRRSPRRCRI